MRSATSMIFARCDSGLSISPATCAAMNRLISASTPATIRNTSPRRDLDVTWMEMSEGRGFSTSRISRSGSAARAVAPNADLAENHEPRFVYPQVDDHIDLEGNPNRERDRRRRRSG